MREFVALANEAFEVLGINSDLSDLPEWRAHNPELESYLPEESVTLAEILEGQARLIEHQVLTACGVNPAEWAAWRTTHIAGTYAPAYEWLMRELAKTDVAIAAIEIALTTPIDLTCKDAVKDGVIFVEDCLPSWRLKKVLNVLRQFPWPQEREAAERVARYQVANEAGIPPPRRTLVAMQGKRFTGDSAWGADARLHGIPSDQTNIEYFEYALRELTRGLEIRRRDFLAFSRPEKNEIFQPLLEIFQDTVLLNGAPGTSLSPKLYFNAILSMLGNKLLLEVFLGRGSLDDLRNLDEAVAKRFAEESVSWPGLRSIAELYLGPDISRMLKWS